MNLKKINYVLFVLVLGLFASCHSPVNTNDDTLVNSTYTIIYDGNGSTGTVPTDSNNYEEGEIVTVASVGDLVKTGSTFNGWNTAADGSGTARAAGSTFSMGTEGVTLYAQWTANPTYMVTYDGNGSTGTVPTDSNNYEEGEIVTVASVGDLVKAGKIFIGWNTSADGSGTARAAGSTFSMGTENVTLYAQWITPLAIGDTYQGGKIAYILQAGDPGYVAGVQHGLIAATANQSTGIVWAKPAYQSTSVGGTLDTIGSGSANTDKIIAQNGVSSDYAAGIARSCTDGGYHDWYLPSQEELAKLYINRVAIGGFDDSAYYWSSSEGGASSAWSKHFPVGSLSNQSKSITFSYVRAVRSF